MEQERKIDQMETKSISDTVDKEQLEFFVEKTKNVFLGNLEKDIENSDENEKVPVYINCDDDADGINAALIWSKFLDVKYGDKIEIKYGSHKLTKDSLIDDAANIKHIISLDKFFPERQGQDEVFRNLMSQGKNVLFLDHHDKDLPEEAGKTPEDIAADGGGSVVCITPEKRLFSKIPSGKFTTGLLSYMVTGECLEPNIKERWYENMGELAAISILGDFAQAKWPDFINLYKDQKEIFTRYAKAFQLVQPQNVSEIIQWIRKHNYNLSVLEGEYSMLQEQLQAADDIKNIKEDVFSRDLAARDVVLLDLKNLTDNSLLTGSFISDELSQDEEGPIHAQKLLIVYDGTKLNFRDDRANTDPDNFGRDYVIRKVGKFFSRIGGHPAAFGGELKVSPKELLEVLEAKGEKIN